VVTTILGPRNKKINTPWVVWDFKTQQKKDTTRGVEGRGAIVWEKTIKIKKVTRKPCFKAKDGIC